MEFFMFFHQAVVIQSGSKYRIKYQMLIAGFIDNHMLICRSVVLAPLMEDDDQGQQDYQGQHDASENIRKEEPTDDVSAKVIHENVREENTEQDIDYEGGLPIVSVAVDMDIMHSKTRDEMESINQEASESAENRLETVSVAAKRD